MLNSKRFQRFQNAQIHQTILLYRDNPNQFVPEHTPVYICIRVVSSCQVYFLFSCISIFQICAPVPPSNNSSTPLATISTHGLCFYDLQPLFIGMLSQFALKQTFPPQSSYLASFWAQQTRNMLFLSRHPLLIHRYMRYQKATSSTF